MLPGSAEALLYAFQADDIDPARVKTWGALEQAADLAKELRFVGIDAIGLFPSERLAGSRDGANLLSLAIAPEHPTHLADKTVGGFRRLRWCCSP
jgi:hypothetical protein